MNISYYYRLRFHFSYQNHKITNLNFVKPNMLPSKYYNILLFIMMYVAIYSTYATFDGNNTVI